MIISMRLILPIWHVKYLHAANQIPNLQQQINVLLTSADESVIRPWNCN